MGTRNLTAVMINGEYKIAQYGQWDGYPSGQGKTILEFISENENINKLREAINKVRFLDPEGKDKDFIDQYDRNAPAWSNEPDNRTDEQKHWFKSYISRDIGGGILDAVTTSEDNEIILKDSIGFGEDALFCEWAYKVDLDKNTLEVYQDFTGEPLKIYQLNKLPTLDVFVAELEKDEEE